MFIVTLFRIETIWNQPRCPSMDEWIKKVVLIHNEILFSHKRRKFCHCDKMDGNGGH
jgi:hypothetical protein